MLLLPSDSSNSVSLLLSNNSVSPLSSDNTVLLLSSNNKALLLFSEIGSATNPHSSTKYIKELPLLYPTGKTRGSESMAPKEIKTTIAPVTIDELQKLREENNILKLALQKTKVRKVKKGFRPEGCKTPNSFHLSFASIFTTEELEARYPELIVSNSDEEVVFKDEIRKILISRIRENKV